MDELSQILSVYAECEWDRVTRALALIGARQLGGDLRCLTVRQVEDMAYGAVPSRGDAQVAVLARQMDQIRMKLDKMDNKLNAKETGRAGKPRQRKLRERCVQKKTEGKRVDCSLPAREAKTKIRKPAVTRKPTSPGKRERSPAKAPRERKELTPAIHQLVETCADSPIINYFSDEYQQRTARDPNASDRMIPSTSRSKPYYNAL